ncbi:MAG: hypothetical protein II224_02590 [Ruminococcus sp.]|nr:hypothetical protein [Ruminococcus sp.]MBQ1310182.1 hypothetical protein [Ruminococcus sp.]MBQ1974676.1 hypothetical protein [Ruminococcus sp.]MBQ2568907.1 hypothetical protein [Ruminococcus sp.]
MSVMIRGMEMPSGCNTCQLHVLCFDYYVCRAKKLERGGYLDVDDKVIEGRRHRCCPLVEIPTPHGRLIDADALMECRLEPNHYEELKDGYIPDYDLDSAPTIIEAEVSE